MKKILKCTFRDLIILICILIFSAFVLMAAVGDALDGSSKITQNDLTNNAEMYSQQLDAGASTKFVFEHGTRIERVENVKDVNNYILRIDEMLERKRVGIQKYLNG